MKSIAVFAVTLLSLMPTLSTAQSFQDDSLTDYADSYEIESVVKHGRPVTEQDRFWHSVVMLTYPNALCSGVVISSQFVLTAGHCLQHGSPLRVVFFKGSQRKDSRRVVKTYKHPKASLQNDVALIQFEGGLPSGEYYPFKTLKDISTLKSSEKIFIAGFGQKNTSRSSYGHLTFGTGTMSSSSERALGFTSSTNQGPCPGDSGSPAFAQRDGQIVLVGIASIGYGPCDDHGGGGIYMSVPYFWPWIQSVVQNAKRPAARFYSL